MDLPHKIRSLPTSPGVYLYKNAEGDIIYVGRRIAREQEVGRRLMTAIGMCHRAKHRELITIWAIRGMCSPTSKPGRLLAIGLKLPRNSAGAFSWSSHISRWLGPPPCQIKNDAHVGKRIGSRKPRRGLASEASRSCRARRTRACRLSGPSGPSIRRPATIATRLVISIMGLASRQR